MYTNQNIIDSTTMHVLQSTNNKTIDGLSITTDGMLKNYFDGTIGNIPEILKNNKNEDKYAYCLTCDKYYPAEIVIEYDFDGNGKCEKLCKHCIWIINEDQESRCKLDLKLSEKNDGLYKYIIDCSPAHDIKHCVRSKNNATCLLCDYKAGKKINMILPEELEKFKHQEFDIILNEDRINRTIIIPTVLIL